MYHNNSTNNNIWCLCGGASVDKKKKRGKKNDDNLVVTYSVEPLYNNIILLCIGYCRVEESMTNDNVCDARTG